MIKTPRSEIVFCLLVLWVTLIGCGGGGGSGESGGGLPFVDGSATGGERNSVCLAGASSGEVVRPQFLTNLEGQTSWHASPVVADLDGDGQNEVVGVPNIEKYEPYETQAYAIMVLEGAHGDGSRSAMRKRGWETLPRAGVPIAVAGWYPPNGIPAPTTVNIQGDSRPEIVVSLNDGFIHAYTADAMEIWRFNYLHGKAVMYASEATVADLNQDGSPEIVFATYGNPDVRELRVPGDIGRRRQPSA
jgi:hypothetical protein